MAGLLRMARDAERDGVRDVSLFGGFPYADSPHCAAKVVAWADSEPAARQAAAALADAWRAQKQAFRSVLPGPNMALAQALKAPAGLVAVTDVADNPGSGGGADSTTLFRALLDLKLSEPAVFAYFFDASLVEQARAVGTGGAFDAEIGARNSRDFGARVQAPARVLRLTDGVFRNRGPLGFGAAVGIGASALLDVAGVKTIVTSQRVRADDPAFFELHGIDLAATRLLCVKAKNRFRAAFRPLCVRIIDCDAPGPATADLRALPFQNVKMR
jgi:microcystin degradation protein MlrC